MWRQLKPHTGTYGLIYESKSSRSIRIGKLGILKLQAGYYLYVGSAFGPGGIKARVRHHLGESSSPHWHVDYLKSHCHLLELWVAYSNAKCEQIWVSKLAKSKDVSIPLAGFGASDTPAVSHLFYFKAQPQVSILAGDSIFFNVRCKSGAETFR